MSPPEVNVRIGELAVSDSDGGVLVSIGLGSCIGLVLLDGARGIGGLAHIMLPVSSSTGAATPGKFADLAVPALIERLERLGASRRQLEAVLVGGARMFSFAASATLDVGARNIANTQQALSTAGIPVRASATGGSVRRTVRVLVDEGAVLLREVGAETRELHRARARPRRAVSA